MMKEKKLDRIGKFRSDGKQYKLQSLKKLDERHMRLVQKVEIEGDDQPVAGMQFPNATWPAGIAPASAPVEFDDFGFGFRAEIETAETLEDEDRKTMSRCPPAVICISTRLVLKSATCCLSRGNKVALVGRNGAGKSSLLKSIATTDSAATGTDPFQQIATTRGRFWAHPALRVGYLSQFSVRNRTGDRLRGKLSSVWKNFRFSSRKSLR